jgi:diguanylate cyclase (GGDEF)-like protein/PAS domain S-box-containing protein
MWSGLIISLIAAAGMDYFFLSPRLTFIMGHEKYWVEILLFEIQAVFLVFLTEMLQNARTKAEEEKQSAEREKQTSEASLKKHRESEERFRRIVESNMIGIIFFSVDGRITDCNDEFLLMTGYSEEDLLEERITWRRITPPEYKELDDQALTELSVNEVFAPFEKEFIRKDGEHVPVLVGGALFQNSKSEGVAFVLNLHKQKEAEDTIRHQAYHDALTDLPNRLLLKERLNHACRHAKRYHQHAAVLLLDLDRFKIINDSLGHQVGDEILKEVAHRLTACVRDEDTVSRFGGDEFVLVLDRISDKDDVLRVVDAIYDALKSPIIVDDKELYVNTSIGIAIYPHDGLDEQILIKNADIALYQAKEHGRQTHSFFSTGMDKNSGTTFTVEEDLRNALKRDELVIYYQPIFDISTKELVYAEALVRWNHPTRGLLLPGEFIQAAEESGLIHELGDWVLEQVSMQIVAWDEAKIYDKKISVNVSPVRFYRPAFIEQFKEILRETKVDPCRLVIEVTENLAMKHVETAIVKLAELADMGIDVSLDDFGMGNSTLNYLKILPITRLKIDKSFIQSIEESEADLAIVETIYSLAHKLNLRVTAEGVETEDQLKCLKKLKACDDVQGFLLSKPLSVKDFEKFIL